MMKGKWYVIALASIVFITAASIFVFTQSKQHITMASTVMSTQNAKAFSLVELNEKSIENEWVYVTKDNGEKVDVPVKVVENNTIEIDRLNAGRYKLHIQKKALQKKTIFMRNQIVQFEVIEKLASIKTKKELEEYFEKIAKLHESKSDGREFNIKTETTEMAVSDMAESSGSSHSSTNNQVEGIEEADVAVTDGEVIYTVSGANVFLIDAKDPASLKELAAIRLKEHTYVEQLLLHKNYLIVSYSDYIEQNEKGEYIYEGYAKIGIYDISNKQNPKLVRDYGHEGYSVAIRKTNDTLYFITQNSPDYWAWYYEDGDESLTPAIYDSEEGGKTELNLDKISILPNSTEPNFTTISAIDLSSGESVDIQTESYLGSSAGFYMSHNAMYLTAERYETVALNNNRIMMDIAIAGVASETSIYRFAVNGTNVSFTGQTTVAGSILNQFSMDEHNGYFRVATTSGKTRGANADSTSAILIFDGAMNQVGEVGDLAKGERIYSARFMGDKAYIVTFKETDPLFTFDLSNPTNPKVLGELKIPGYSTYLHPVGEDHLLGLGYETKVIEIEGSTFVEQVGLKLSLFNVKDLNNPIEQDVEIIGGVGTYSQAIHSHKAFFIHKEKNLYGFPVSMYDYHKNPNNSFLGEGAILYKVTPETGITVAANFISKAKNQTYEVWEEQTQRLLYINDAFYLVKQRQIDSYDLNRFNQLGTVRFQ